MKSKIDHRSPRLFSTGVPVSAIRACAFSALAARVCLAAGFLIACASSRIAQRQRDLRQSRHPQQRAVAGDRQIEPGRLRRRELPRSPRPSSPRDARSAPSGRGRSARSPPPSWPAARRAPPAGRRPRRRVAVLPLHQQQRQHLDGLAQPHVVGQAGAQPEPGQQMQPLHAGLLVGPQRAVQGRAGIDAGAVRRAQRLQRLGQPRPRASPATTRRRRRRRRRASTAGAGQHPHRLGERQPVCARPVPPLRGTAASCVPAARGRPRPIGRAAAPDRRCRRAAR